MIRQANKYDKDIILELIKQFYIECGFDMESCKKNQSYHEQLFYQAISGKGVIFIKENIGMLFAIISNPMISSEVLVMNCLAWAVKKEYRNTKVGVQLMEKYIEYGEQLKKEGRIKYYTVGKRPETPNLNYEKFGFRKLDETWAR